MFGKCIHPKEAVPALVVAGSMPDQEQTNKVEKRRLLGIIYLERFESRRNCPEHFLIGEWNSHKRGINGTDITTHGIERLTEWRILAQVGKVCRHDFRRQGGKASGREKTHTKVMKVREGHQGNVQVVRVELFPSQEYLSGIKPKFRSLGIVRNLA
jgi:hypothetical protein